MSFTEAEIVARRNTLGASEIAAVAGLNPWKTAHNVWLEKMGLADDANNTTTRAGELMEPVILQLYREETGAEIAHFGSVVHPKHTWMSATPDFAVAGKPVVGEAKFVGWRLAHHWGTEPEDVPDYYRPQAEWQMECCEADEGHVAALVGGPDFRIYTVKRDRELAGLLIDIGGKFWRDYVINKRPPPVDGSESARAMLAKLFPRDTRPLLTAAEEHERIARELAAARKEASSMETRVATLENQLREAIGDAAGIRGTGWTATWKVNKRGVRPLLFKVKDEVAA